MPSVAIVGGGYAGVRAARVLASRLDSDWSITLFDPGANHELTTRLLELFRGSIGTNKVGIPYRDIMPSRVDHVASRVELVDAALRRVHVSGEVQTFDWIVIALGAEADLAGISGAATHSLPLRSIAHVMTLREQLDGLRAAGRTARVVIIGAGYTSTELAGELAATDGVSVMVVASDPCLLPDGNEHLGAIAELRLQRRGVEFRLGSPVKEVTKSAVTFQTGESVEADVVVWAAQARAVTALRSNSWRHGQRGRIRVDPFLRAEKFDAVFVVGDAAQIHDYRRDRPVAASAQEAVAQASSAAENLVRLQEVRPLLEYKSRPVGEALSLGSMDGVAEIGGVVLVGRPAVAAKSVALRRYLMSLGGPSLVRKYM